MVGLGILLGLVWGAIWAAFLQYTNLGAFLAIRRTWITVVIGVGVDLLILLLIVPLSLWWQICWIISASSVFIIGRSLYREYWEEKGVMDVYKDQISQQDNLEPGGHHGGGTTEPRSPSSVIENRGEISGPVDDEISGGIDAQHNDD